MSDSSRQLLERALQAEDELEARDERIEDLTGRLKAVLNNEPESASRALSWIGRAENAESLLIELVKKLSDGRVPMEALGEDARSLITRIKAQLHTVTILRRDQAALGEKPPDNEWWESWKDEGEGRPLRTTSDGSGFGDILKPPDL